LGVANTCSVCKHPKRRAVDGELVRGTSYRDIAGRFGLSSSAVERHMSHVAELVAKGRDAADALSAEVLMGELRELRTATLVVLDQAKAMAVTPGDCSTCERGPRLALQAVQRLEKQTELQGRFLGELSERTIVHSSVFDEDWLKLRAVIVGALRLYPDAAASVLEALAKAGDRAA
jgi:hypothetical protein